VGGHEYLGVVSEWQDGVLVAIALKGERRPGSSGRRSEEKWHAQNAVPPGAPVAIMAA
jgi:hypothetical protein